MCKLLGNIQWTINEHSVSIQLTFSEIHLQAYKVRKGQELEISLLVKIAEDEDKARVRAVQSQLKEQERLREIASKEVCIYKINIRAYISAIRYTFAI